MGQTAVAVFSIAPVSRPEKPERGWNGRKKKKKKKKRHGKLGYRWGVGWYCRRIKFVREEIFHFCHTSGEDDDISSDSLSTGRRKEKRTGRRDFRGGFSTLEEKEEPREQGTRGNRQDARQLLPSGTTTRGKGRGIFFHGSPYS